MQVIRLRAIGKDVILLQQMLVNRGYKVDVTGLFDEQTDTAVRAFQQSNGLDADGIVGSNTWKSLQGEVACPTASYAVTEEDFRRCADTLGVDVAAVKAIREIETGDRGGFLVPGRPVILFDVHVFWKQLKLQGLHPENYVKGNEDILYPRWTKSFYKGGMGEYSRLRKALSIHEGAAACSASWGLFQIMGFNYAACGCRDVREFVGEMCRNEGGQLNLFTAFLKSNGWDKYLRTLNWREFARCYNGPQYAQNRYDEKLHKAYMKYREKITVDKGRFLKSLRQSKG